jgi:hypothetical protein
MTIILMIDSGSLGIGSANHGKHKSSGGESFPGRSNP